MNELAFDLQSLRAAYAREDGPRPSDVVREALRRASAGPAIAWLSRFDDEELLRRARALDLRRGERERLPLYGIPFAVKDNIDVSGLPTTAGCPDFAYRPKQSAHVVSRLLAAGAIPLGKTHLDQFATGLVGTRHPAGACSNAFLPEYISGGSSSGSAVVTAIDQVSFALGTDTAGSGRVPAALNDLVGLKPTRGLLSSRGVVPACRSLDCVSIFAKNAGDAREILRVTAVYDALDPFARPAPAYAVPTPRREADAFVFAIPRGESLDLDPQFHELWRRALARLDDLGGRAIEVDFRPFHEAAALLYDGPWLAERFAAVGEFVEREAAAVLPVTREIILKGKSPAAVDGFRASYRLAELRAKIAGLRREYGIDFFMTPTIARAYRIQEIEADPLALNSDLGIYTNYMNLLDQAAVAVPIGRRSDGLPWGVTIFADAGSDNRLLDYADALAFSASPDVKPAATVAPVDAVFRTEELEEIVVCGAHMSGMALNHQLVERGGRLIRKTRTAPVYRFFALPGNVPRPGLIRLSEADLAAVRAAGEDAPGAPPPRGVAVEVWGLPRKRWADFIAGIPEPLGIGTVLLADGVSCKGFICEAFAAQEAGAVEITHLADWRRFIREREPS